MSILKIEAPVLIAIARFSATAPVCAAGSPPRRGRRIVRPDHGSVPEIHARAGAEPRADIIGCPPCCSLSRKLELAVDGRRPRV